MRPITIVPLSNGYTINIYEVVTEFEEGNTSNWLECDYGNFVVAIYNCDFSCIMSTIISAFNKYDKNNPEEFTENCFEDYIKYMDNTKGEFDPVIVITLFNEVHSHLYHCMNNPECDLIQGIRNIFENYMLIKLSIKNNIENSFENIEMEPLTRLQEDRIFAKFFLDKRKQVRVAYTMADIYSLFALDILNIQEKNIEIKFCENCGRLFIPKIRSDEIYCDHININGKTCKQVGYTNQLKSDPFKAEYRKAYKTQHAKMKRNLKNIPNYKEKYFDPWVDAAKNAMEQSRSENNIEAFAQWVKEHS